VAVAGQGAGVPWLGVGTVRTISLPAPPFADLFWPGNPPTFDPANGNLYLETWNAGTVGLTVVSSSTDEVVANFPLGGTVQPLTLDPSNGNIYVPCPPNLTVVSGQTNTVIAELPLGDEVGTPAYDSANGNLYVPASPNLVELSSSNNTVVATLPVGPSLTPVYDPANENLYVPSSNVTVISTLTNRVVGHIPVDWAYSIFAGPNDDVYISNLTLQFVYVVSGTNSTILGTIPMAGTNLWPPAFDPRTDLLFFTTAHSDNLSAVSLATNRIVGTVPLGGSPGAPVFDNVSGDLFVANAGFQYITVISDRTLTVFATVSTAASAETPAFDSQNGDLYFPDFAGNLIVVAGGGPNIVKFTESGIPPGFDWSVELKGMVAASQGSTVSFMASNGLFNFTVSPISGYSASPSSGQVTVNGSEVDVSITFSGTGIAWYYEWLAIAVTVGGIAAVVAAVVVLRRRKKARQSLTDPHQYV
jgi:hypothetical protein